MAAEQADVSDETTASLAEVTQEQVERHGTISRPTALLVDKSGSMREAIEFGKRLAAMVSGIADDDLYVYTFDTAPRQLEADEASIAGWERASEHVTAGGRTSVGTPLEVMRTRGQSVEQIVVVTDEAENTAPDFADALRQYNAGRNRVEQVVIVRVEAHSYAVSDSLDDEPVAVDTWTFDGDYYSLPNLVPFLTKASRLELLAEVMETPLPERDDA